jgi:VWFA-related protein
MAHRAGQLRIMLGTLVLLGALALASSASAGRPEIRQIDLSSYPLIRVTVVLPSKATIPPTASQDGAPTVPVSAENLGDKESVSLVIDHSQSMHGQALAQAIRAARVFIAAIPNPDQISVIGVASQALNLSSFSDGHDAADEALSSLSVDRRYGTTLWDALVLAANQLRKHGLPGRTIILVTDGQQTTSKATLRQAIRAAQSARARIYTVGIPDRSFTPTPLIELARATGGRYYRAPSAPALVGIYRSIAAELDRTWQLQFLTATRPGDTLKLTVRGGGAFAHASKALPSDLGSATSTGSPFLVLTVALIAVIGGLAAILLTPIVRRMRPARWRRRSPIL